MRKERVPGSIPVSISLSKETLAKIDAKAAAVGLSRTGYLRHLALADVARGGVPSLPMPAPAPTSPASRPPVPGPQDPARPKPRPYEINFPKPLAFTLEAYDFLFLAVPAMQEYEAARAEGNRKPPGPSATQIPPKIAESTLWRLFLLEREDILGQKQREPKTTPYPVGFSLTLQNWLQCHRGLWAPATKSKP
jgi:hypothetical protein